MYNFYIHSAHPRIILIQKNSSRDIGASIYVHDYIIHHVRNMSVELYRLSTTGTPFDRTFMTKVDMFSIIASNDYSNISEELKKLFLEHFKKVVDNLE